MADDKPARRILTVNAPIGAREPRRAVIRPKKLGDYPGVAQAYLDIARKLSSPLRMGPPLCDELIAFVQHVFTEDEAGVVRHLGQLGGMTADDLARAEHRPVEQIRPLLHSVAQVKHAVAAGGPDGEEKYRLLPIMPGIFEMVLIGQSPENLSPWHRRFAELVEALYQTGYYGDYLHSKSGASYVRVLPVGRAIEAHPMALPSDQLEVVLDRYDAFAVGYCQCRMTQQVADRDCGKPIRVCTVMGRWAQEAVRHEGLQQISKREVLQIKRDAEEHGLVTWIMNVEATKGQCSCSCCPCCCYALRIINDFNAPAVMAPAHFLPRFDDAKCSYCGRCAERCPTRAVAVEPQQRSRAYQRHRCVGCGLCAVACDRQKAIAMEPVPDYKLPYRSWFSMIASSAPRFLQTAYNVWRSR